MASHARDLTALYQSLPLHQRSRCIRVLKVFGPSTSDDGNGSEEELLHCDLQIVDLNTKPSFSALSYVWGKSPPKHEQKTIICGAVTVPVTENCFDALIYLRRKLQSFNIWIDALCINQADEVEKGQQISLMKDIYLYASQVYLWLGRDNERMSRAIRYFDQMGLLDCYHVNGQPEQGELSKPREWTAAQRCLFAFWRSNQLIFPFCGSPFHLGSSCID